LFWTHTALADLDNIHRYIAQDSLFYADSFCLEILDAVDQIEKFPKIGRKVPEWNEDRTREVVVKDYRVVYQASMLRIEILTTIHGAKLLKRES
jgi:toxin ParE1/3/4